MCILLLLLLYYIKDFHFFSSSNNLLFLFRQSSDLFRSARFLIALAITAPIFLEFLAWWFSRLNHWLRAQLRIGQAVVRGLSLAAKLFVQHRRLLFVFFRFLPKR